MYVQENWNLSLLSVVLKNTLVFFVFFNLLIILMSKMILKFAQIQGVVNNSLNLNFSQPYPPQVLNCGHKGAVVSC